MAEKFYAVVLGIVFAVFIGFGFAAFYPSPTFPTYPAELTTADMTKTGPPQYTTEEKALLDQYNKDQSSYQVKFADYNRNLAAILVGIGVILFIIGSFIFTETFWMSGLRVGGFLTILYGVIRSIMSDNAKIMFVTISAALVIMIIFGYIRFHRTIKKVVAEAK